MSSKKLRRIEFVGGYVNTDEGVRKERGVVPHLNRNAGTYAGLLLGGPIIGAPIGAAVDHWGRKPGNISITAQDKPLSEEEAIQQARGYLDEKARKKALADRKRAQEAKRAQKEEENMHARLHATEFGAPMPGALRRINRSFHGGGRTLPQAIGDQFTGAKRRLKRGWEQMGPQYGGGMRETFKRGWNGMKHGGVPVQSSRYAMSARDNTIEFAQARLPGPGQSGIVTRAGKRVVRWADDIAGVSKRRSNREYQNAVKKHDNARKRYAAVDHPDAKEMFRSNPEKITERYNKLQDARASRSAASRRATVHTERSNTARRNAGIVGTGAVVAGGGVYGIDSYLTGKENKERMARVRAARRDMSSLDHTTDFAFRDEMMVRAAKFGRNVWGGQMRNARTAMNAATDARKVATNPVGRSMLDDEVAKQSRIYERRRANTMRDRRRAAIGVGTVGVGVAGASMLGGRRNEYAANMQFVTEFSQELDNALDLVDFNRGEDAIKAMYKAGRWIPGADRAYMDDLMRRELGHVAAKLPREVKMRPDVQQTRKMANREILRKRNWNSDKTRIAKQVEAANERDRREWITGKKNPSFSAADETTWELEDRPRNAYGQFEEGGEAAPSPEAMNSAYRESVPPLRDPTKGKGRLDPSRVPLG